MAAEIVCDGCGRREKMVFYKNGEGGWQKPHKWYQRQDEDGPQDACCRDCIDKVAKKTGKSPAIFPI